MEYDEEIKFLCMLERVTEPLYIGPKGHGATKYLYNLPSDYLEPYQAQAMVELRKLIPPSTTIVEIPVIKPSVPYDLTKIQQAVPKNVVFSEMNEDHLRASFELARILTSESTRSDFFNACALCRDSVNPHLWVHAFLQSALRRPDMRGFRLPAIWEIMPDFFIERRSWSEAVKQSTLPSRERAIVVIDKNFTGTNLNPEHKVAYFREDIGMNSHHWHWHFVNSFMAPKGSIDRQGEIFYYMHHDMLARYDCERMANGLNRVVAFDCKEDIVPEGYFPKLTIQNTASNYPARQENTKWKDINRSRDADSSFLRFVTLREIRSWCDRIFEAIDAGFAIQETGGRVDLRTEKGIDIVTAMWESSNNTPHRKYYGMAHNFGHVALSLSHDPDFRHREPPGVMYYTSTACRDPIFWRWHKFLDSISQRQKDYLAPYPRANLQWSGIVANEILVERLVESLFPVTLDPKNNLITHWMQSDVELSRGLDFGRTNINGLGSVWARTTHLQHLAFVYRIRVTNQSRADVQATFRIFMAPKLDENGDKLPFHEQRILFFEMDKFTTIVHPGESIISRNSRDSTLTVPWAQTFREIERDVGRLSSSQAMCSCGWPDHLLLPRGTVDGMPFDLFVMLTNTQIDQVPSSRRQLGTLTPKGTCKDSISFCGLVDDKFPDSRAMGYPFDRPAVENEKADSNMFLSDFVTPVPNMTSTEVKIFHVDKTIVRANGAPDTLRKIYVSP